MIAGYASLREEPALEQALREQFGCEPVSVKYPRLSACFWHRQSRTAQRERVWFRSPAFLAISDDLLVWESSSGGYTECDLTSDFSQLLVDGSALDFDRLVTNYCMAVLDLSREEPLLHLLPHRAGPGRIYYHTTDFGIVFSSDFRLLLKIVGLDFNNKALWAILKYGAAPEPLTVSSNISSVPAAHRLTYGVYSSSVKVSPFFSLRFETTLCASKSGDQFLERSKAALKSSMRLLGGRNAAVLLSGGVDSSLLLNFMAESADKPVTCYFCSLGENDPEMKYAAAVAERSRSHLEVMVLQDRDVLPSIEMAADHCDHPFSDFSIVPTSFLINNIRRFGEQADIVVDGNGGDDCFGIGLFGIVPYWQLLYRVPKLLKSLASWAWPKAGLWSRRNAFEIILWKLHQAGDPAVETCPFVMGHTEWLAERDGWNEEICDLILNHACSCLAKPGSDRLRTRLATVQIMHVNSRMWAAKSYSVARDLGIRVVYPFIWRDILIEQGKIPWGVKLRNGIAKWPLKRMLEEYMPRDFIYRRKVGFSPPLAKWIAMPAVNAYLRELLLDSNSCISEIFPLRTIRQILRRGTRLMNQPAVVLNMLWGAAFVELWLRRHWHR